ncbi:MAG TPA: DUF1848 domain-containing protein [Spirochaetales bacterium]|nr:DUF1848 domain-containing protein [Spirochaetales bacterium]HRY53471.1 DUF1848 domain-containing protein [Spirochaetia bacterium]
MLVSASRRCDLPAFRMGWLMERLREGRVEVPNPYDARRSRLVGLAPAEVECMVFWTRDPRPLAARARELEELGYRFYAQVTITGYPPELEPGCLRPPEAVGAFAALAEAVGPERALWRYDPILVAAGLDADWHRRNFAALAAALEGRTRRVTLSLLDEYAHTQGRLERAGFPGAVFGSPRKPGAAAAALPPEPYPGLLAELASIARSRGIEPLACAEPYDLSGLGIGRGACVDPALIEALFGVAIGSGKDRGQRPGCGCAPSVDIGEYGSCPAACAYCYARR